MRDCFKRFVMFVLIFSMILGMTYQTPSTVATAAQVSEDKVETKELKPFISTEDLVAQMNEELAKMPKDNEYSLESEQKKERLGDIIDEYSRFSLEVIMGELENAIFKESSTTSVSVFKYDLGKEELMEIVELVLDKYHAKNLVEVTFEVNQKGIATIMYVEMLDGFSQGIDEIETLDTSDSKSTQVTTMNDNSKIKTNRTSSRFSETEDEVIHDYDEPSFVWADDYSSCTVTFACKDCDYVETIICEDPVMEVLADSSITYTAVVIFKGKEYSNTENSTTKKLKIHWGEMCEFYSANTEYYGVPVSYWTAKNTQATPLGAIKVLAGYNADDPIPAANMDEIVVGLTQAFQAYVYYYGEALLAYRDQALAQLDDSMTDVQKCLVLHDYVGTHAVFDMTSLTNYQNGGGAPDAIEMTPFGALLCGRVDGINGCVCIGYTAVYTLLVQCAFPEIYRDSETSKFKSSEQVKEAGNDIVDFAMVKYNADVSVASVAGPESGFEGVFTEPHYFNAVKVDGQWYYVDACYDDIKPETLSQYRVETDGLLAHLYFLYSHQSMADWYDGFYDYFDSLHDENAAPEMQCSSEQYEEAWFSNSDTPFYYDDNYWYYVDKQISNKQMMEMMDMMEDQEGEDSGLGDIGSQFDMSDYGDQLKARPRTITDDLSTDGNIILIDYGKGEVTKLENQETVVNDMLLKSCNEHSAAAEIYPEISHGLGQFQSKIFFNVDNQIWIYDLSTGDVSILKEYNDVSMATDGTSFLGSSFYLVDDNADNVMHHVKNHPLASICIKDDGTMYISVATTFTNSKASLYQIESVNYNSSYNRFSKNNTEEDNSNVEFMWCANVKEKISMEDIMAFLSSPSGSEVTVEPWCTKDGFTEVRGSHGLSSESRTNPVEALGHHYVYVEKEKCYICDRCHAAMSVEDMEAAEHTYGEPKFVWQEEQDSYTCKAVFECACGYAKEIECDVTQSSNIEPTKTEQGFLEYTAKCTFLESEYTATKEVILPASDVEYSEPSFEWTEKEEGGYTCIATFTSNTVIEPTEEPTEDVVNEFESEITSQTVNTLTRECVVTEVVTEPTNTEKGSIIYTATCTLNEIEYSDNKTSILQALPTFTWTAKEGDNAGYTCKASYIEKEGESAKEKECLINYSATSATCTESGEKVYTAICSYLGKIYMDDKKEEIPATGHTYTPYFDWQQAEDGTMSCNVSFVCIHQDDVQPVECNLTSETIENETEVTVTYTATCTFNEVRYKDTKVVVTSKHTFGEPVFTWTETEDGDYACSAEFTCTDCEEKHTEDCVVTKEVINATCTAEGTITYTASCSFQGEYQDVKVETIPVTSHSYGAPVFTWTENAEGGYSCNATFTCTNCDDVQNVACDVVADTSAADQITYTASCTFMEQQYSDTKVVELTPVTHVYGEPVFTWTETEDGDYACSAEFTCTDCGEKHTEDCIVTKEVINATCTAEGTITYTASCSFQGEYQDVKVETIPVTSHSYGAPVFTWTENTEGGYSCNAAFTCTNCDDVQNVVCDVVADTSAADQITYIASCTFMEQQYSDTKVVELTSVTHVYGAPVFTWTQNADGDYTCSAEFTCTDCGEKHTETCVVTKEVINATCTTEGSITYTAKCNFNGEYQDVKVVTIPVTGHSYGNPVFNWMEQSEGGYSCNAAFTCMNGDDVQYVECDVVADSSESIQITYTATCTFNGQQYSDTKVVELQPVAHVYGEPVFTWTQNAQGIYTCSAEFTCTDCGEKHTETCVVTKVVVDATCTTEGSITYTAKCNFNGEYQDVKVEAIVATGHNYGTPVFNWTKKTDGDYSCNAVFTCMNGDDTQTVICQVTSKVVKEATTSQTGTKEYISKCTFQGKDYEDRKTEVIPVISGGSTGGTGGFGGGFYIPPVVIDNIPKVVELTNPENLKVLFQGYNKIKISWDVVKDAKSYSIYRKSSDGWEKLTTTRDTSYVDNDVACGNVYEYAVAAVNDTVESDYDAVSVSAMPKLDTPVTTLKTANYNQIELRWDKISGADGYVVYRWDGAKWVRSKTIKDAETLTYTTKKLTCGKTYKYTVVAYRMVDDQQVISDIDENGVSGKTVLTTPEVRARAGKQFVKIAWNKVTGANGYYIYRWNGTKWTKIKTVNKGTVLSCKDIDLVSGEEQLYTVVAYRKVNDKVVRSSYDKDGVSVTVK